jgi:acetyl esterase/lipase
VTVVPDYRLFPAARFPAFLRDNAAAVAWTKANIARYGGDPRRIFLMGHSAGAYNAVMLTLDRQWFGAEGLDPDRDITGTAGLAGPYDFLPLRDTDHQAIFAPAGDLRLSQPITFARGDAPPLLLATGSADTMVLPRNTQRLAAAIRRDGGAVEERVYPGVNHTRIIGAMAGVVRWLAPSMADVTGFLSRYADRSAVRGGVRESRDARMPRVPSWPTGHGNAAASPANMDGGPLPTSM